ncbi:MAG: transporter permease [Frankiales bacterium]|nr:transporter permease [Frankiales bacterium]
MTATADVGIAATAVAAPQAATSKRRLPLSAKIAGGVILIIVLLAIFAPLLTSYSPTVGSLTDRLQPIGTSGHLLGTDGQGRDILTRMLYGARPSLMTGLIPVAVSGTLGTTLGLIAGMGSKFTRGAIMRTLDVFYAFPAVLLAIAIAAALGSGISNSVIALAVILIPPVARVAESETGRLRSADFIEAANASGARKSAIAFRQVLPNIAPAVVVYCTALIGLSIVYAAGLSFLGLGISPPKAEWGLMISDLQQYIFTQPQLLLVPAIAILIASVAFNVLGDGLRSYLNVRSETA